jgi:hypothetical protein
MAGSPEEYQAREIPSIKKNVPIVVSLKRIGWTSADAGYGRPVEQACRVHER